MMDFFTNKVSAAPQLSLFWQFTLLDLLGVFLYATYRFYRNPWFYRSVWWLQLLQVVTLYLWYAIMSPNWSEGLPFYHCRLAMLVLLFGRKGLLKRYFAYMGLFGSIVAFIYPVFDEFSFPHVTFFTFVVGHYALAINSLIYILEERREEAKPLRIRQMTILTLLLNGLIGIVNTLTGGNYGFLRQTPIINSTHSVLNFYLVTLVFVLAMFLVQEIILFLSRKYNWRTDG